MDKIKPILREIESQWPIHIHRGISELIRLHPGETFYAGAFWILYCDYTNIAAPTFGVNSESALKDERDRWLPPEWRWDVVKTVNDGMEPLYQQLSAALAGAADKEWEAVIAANEQLIGRVCRTVTESARRRSGMFAHLSLPKDFVVFAGDVREDTDAYHRQLRLSVDEAILTTLGIIESDA